MNIIDAGLGMEDNKIMKFKVGDIVKTLLNYDDTYSIVTSVEINNKSLTVQGIYVVEDFTETNQMIWYPKETRLYTDIFTEETGSDAT